MTAYNIKGIIGFIVVVGLIIAALASGELSSVISLVLLLLVGVAVYYGGRYLVRLITGFDPHEGSTRKQRSAEQELENLTQRMRKIESKLETIDDPQDKMEYLQKLEDPPPYFLKKVKKEIKSEDY